MDAILRSISTISTLLELQGKQRLLRFGEVAGMLDCVGVAGAESSISREVAHTCAAIGARRDNLELFTQEGGFDPNPNPNPNPTPNPNPSLAGGRLRPAQLARPQPQRGRAGRGGRGARGLRSAAGGAHGPSTPNPPTPTPDP